MRRFFGGKDKGEEDAKPAPAPAPVKPVEAPKPVTSQSASLASDAMRRKAGTGIAAQGMSSDKAVLDSKQLDAFKWQSELLINGVNISEMFSTIPKPVTKEIRGQRGEPKWMLQWSEDSWYAYKEYHLQPGDRIRFEVCASDSHGAEMKYSLETHFPQNLSAYQAGESGKAGRSADEGRHTAAAASDVFRRVSGDKYTEYSTGIYELGLEGRDSSGKKWCIRSMELQIDAAQFVAQLKGDGVRKHRKPKCLDLRLEGKLSNKSRIKVAGTFVDHEYCLIQWYRQRGETIDSAKDKIDCNDESYVLTDEDVGTQIFVEAYPFDGNSIEGTKGFLRTDPIDMSQEQKDQLKNKLEQQSSVTLEVIIDGKTRTLLMGKDKVKIQGRGKGRFGRTKDETTLQKFTYEEISDVKVSTSGSCTLTMVLTNGQKLELETTSSVEREMVVKIVKLSKHGGEGNGAELTSSKSDRKALDQSQRPKILAVDIKNGQDPFIGRVLTAVAQVENVPSPIYAWYRTEDAASEFSSRRDGMITGGVLISGASTCTYIPTADDMGVKIRVEVGFVIGTSRDSMSAVTKAPVHIPAQLNEKLQTARSSKKTDFNVLYDGEKAVLTLGNKSITVVQGRKKVTEEAYNMSMKITIDASCGNVMHITLNREHAAISLSALNNDDRDVIVLTLREFIVDRRK